MFTVEEICEEQERQYNQLMQEDDQYCHPESFKWGFEHGVEYALSKFGWHPASELPVIPEGKFSVHVIAYCHTPSGIYAPVEIAYTRTGGWQYESVKWWCYPPKE